MDMRHRLLGEAESALTHGASMVAPIEQGTQKKAFEPEPEIAEDPSRPESAASVSTRVPSRPETPAAAGFAAARDSGFVKTTPQRPVRPASSGPTRRRPAPDESSPLG